MKRLKCVFVLLFAVLSINSHGDVIIPQKLPATIYAKITNLNDYPDITLIGVNECWSIPGTKKAVIIDSDSELKIHNSCLLKFYAVKKDYLDKKDIEKIEWDKDKNVTKTNLTIKGKSYTPSAGIFTIVLHYDIAGFDGSSVVLYKSAQVHKYSDGRPDSKMEFKFDGDLSTLRKEF